MKRLSIPCIFVLIFLLTGCGPALQLRRMKPAEIDMSSMRTLGVLNFAYYQEGYQSVGDLVVGIISKSAGLNYGDNDDLRQAASYATDRLILALKETGYFTIIEPNKLGNPDLDSTTEVEKLLSSSGVGAILAAQLDDASCERQGFIKERKSDRSTKNGKIVIEEPWIRQNCFLALSYKIIGTRGNTLVAKKDFNESRVDEVLESQVSDLYEPKYLLRDLIDRVIAKIPPQLAPYQVLETRFLRVDKTYDPEMKRASNLAKAGNLPQARELFLKRWKATANPAAGYNAAVIYQVEGDLEKALALLREMIDISSDASIVNEHHRVLKALEERRQVEKQLR